MGCHKKQVIRNKKISSSFQVLAGSLLAILPKCPFCVMAYSGAMTMCSGKKIYPDNDSAYSWLMIALSIIVFIGIAMNRRGRRTIYALLTALIGTVLIIISQYIQVSEMIYYAGCFMLLAGIWINGSFYYFLNQIRKKFQLFSFTKFNEI